MSGHYIRPLLTGLGIFTAIYVIEAGLAVRGPRTLVYGALLGVFAALALHWYLRELEATRELRRRQDHEKLIAYLNHHVRNALQLIVNRAELDVHSARELSDIQNAVNRIDWALREILPRVTASAKTQSVQNPFVTPSQGRPESLFRPCPGVYPRYMPGMEGLTVDGLRSRESRDGEQAQPSVLRNKSA